LRLAFRPTALVILVGLGVLAACRQLVGIHDDPPSGPAAESGDAGAGDAAVCGIAYAGAACEACLETSCCPEANACKGDLACSVLEGCLGACDGGDPACRAKCTFAHIVGADTNETQLAACLGSQCEGPCGLPCDGVAEYFGADAAPGCQSCLATTSCAGQTCGVGSACPSSLSCALAYHTLDRLEACAGLGPDAGPTALASLATACGAPCLIGQQWECIGHLETTAPTAQATSLQVELFDQVSAEPVSGAAIGVCTPFALDCAPAPEATTDDGGFAVPPVTVPAAPAGSLQTGYLVVTGVGLYPTLIYWGFPLSEPTAWIETGVLSNADLSLLEAAGVSEYDASVDPSRGIVGVKAVDCDYTPATGVTFDVQPADAETQVFYSTGGALIPTGPTTNLGSAIIVDVPTGLVTIRATPAGFDHPSSVITVLSKAGAFTAAGMPPNQ
jgi:hypothetical protein